MIFIQVVIQIQKDEMKIINNEKYLIFSHRGERVKIETWIEANALLEYIPVFEKIA